MTEVTIPQGFMKNAVGHLVPVDQVREHDLLRDDIARSLAMSAIEISGTLAAFKKKALADIADLISVSSERYGVTIGGKKGNASITTYDGEYRIDRAYAERITFTEEILAAKELVDACIRAWSKGANSHLQVLVDRAFRANKKGEIKTADLLDLLRSDIDDPAWKRAMQALKDSILVVGTAVYVRVYKRDNDTGRYNPISLNIAGV
jgi:hypothetical protein